MMERKKWLLAVLMALMVCATSTVCAQFRYGVKGGVNISKVQFNKDIFEAENVIGFHIGPTVEYKWKLGLGLDAAILYSQKGFRTDFENLDNVNLKNSYIEVPVNVRYKLKIPLISPYVAAGPYMSFLVGDKEKKVNYWISDIFGQEGQLKSKTFGFGVNFTAGLEVLNRIQLGCTYNWGLIDNFNDFNVKDVNYNGKTHTWMISAGVLF